MVVRRNRERWLVKLPKSFGRTHPKEEEKNKKKDNKKKKNKETTMRKKKTQTHDEKKSVGSSIQNCDQAHKADQEAVQQRGEENL